MGLVVPVDASSAGEPLASVVTLAAMRRRHLRAVLRIEAQSEHRPWSLGLFMSELGRPDDRCYLVARAAGQVVGFGGMLFVSGEGHLTTLSVDPAARRGRVGTRLVLALCRHALARGDVTALTLEVRASNEAAQALYRRFGFAPVGVRKGYYEDLGEDAIVMWAHDVDQPAFAARLAVVEASLPAPTAFEGVPW
jgi:[ribosomal protein S18]-alanine N-acetyltransferase